MTAILRKKSWRRKPPYLVGSLQAVVVYSKPLADFYGVELSLSIYDNIFSVHRTLKMTASKSGTGELNDTVFAKLGDSMDLALNFSISGSDVVLQVTNNEAYDLNVLVNCLDYH